MIEKEDIISVGKILKPHGLRGEMNVYCDYDRNILKQDYPLIIEMDGIYVPFYIDSVRDKSTFGVLIKLDGVDCLEETLRFVNKEIYLLRTDVAEFLEIDVDELEKEIYVVGSILYGEDEGLIGRIKDIDMSTENYLLIVESASDPEKELYLPFVEEWITEEEENEAGEIEKLTMKFPEGILEINNKGNKEETI